MDFKEGILNVMLKRFSKNSIKSRCGAWVMFLFFFVLSQEAKAQLFEQALGGEVQAYEADAGVSEESGTASRVLPDTAASEKSYTAGGWIFDLNGHVRGDLFVGKMPDYDRGEVKSGYGELGLKLLVSKAPYGDAFGEVRFQSGYLNDEHYLGKPSDAPAEGFDIGEFEARVKLREAYVNAYIGPLSVRFGHQIVVWGRADGINPTNNITPIDMRVRSPEEDDRRLGNIGVRANLNLSPMRLEGIWMPIYSPSYFPEINLADSIRFANPDYPSTDLAKGTLAGRFHLIFPSFEMSASYLHGFAPLPGLSLVDYNLTQVPASVTIARKAYEHQVVGFDFSTALGDVMGLRGEVAFRYPKEFVKDYPDDIIDYYQPYITDLDNPNQVYDLNGEDRIHIPKPDLYYVLGGDHEFGNVSIIAQYIGRYTLFWEKIPPEPEVTQGLDIDLNNLDEIAAQYGDSLPGATISYIANRELLKKNRLIHNQTEELQHAASLRVEWRTLHDTISLVAFGMMNFSTLEWLVYPKIAYSITDAMTVSVGAEVYNGPEDTLLDLIEEILSAGYAELKISF
jgi:hypothetical protein